MSTRVPAQAGAPALPAPPAALVRAALDAGAGAVVLGTAVDHRILLVVPAGPPFAIDARRGDRRSRQHT
ncbi:MAG TPA: hypothetical protein VGP57_06890 [Actinoplanes sp.]|jgi:hypothetical protein|nr:hypothetical protein [Actinoplanes sp.]